MALVIAVGLLLLGIALLAKGADWLVDGSVDLAYRLKVAPLYVGLTVVAFGTSLPEMVVSLFAAYAGTTDIILGNVIGSNIANVGLFVGIAAIIFPIALSRKLLRVDFPMMLCISILFLFLALRGVFDALAGAVLLSALGIFMWYAYTSRTAAQSPDPRYTILRMSTYVFFGSVGLYIGGKLLVDNAIFLARYFGISELIIGLTIVALGTSVPEIFVGIVAALRRHVGLILGNIIGSNIFNLAWVFGIISLFWEITVEQSVIYDVLIMLFFSLLLYFFAFTARCISRREGVVLLLLYCTYIAYVFL